MWGWEWKGQRLLPPYFFYCPGFLSSLTWCRCVLGKQRVEVTLIDGPSAPMPHFSVLDFSVLQSASLVPVLAPCLSPRAHGLSQPGTKQCHVSGLGERLILGGISGLRRERNDRSKTTNRAGQLPSLTAPPPGRLEQGW